MTGPNPLQTLFDTLPQTGGGITTRVVEGGEIALGDDVGACLGIGQAAK